MPRYLGYINYENRYYNFYPIAFWDENDELIIMDERDFDDLFPNRNLQFINLIKNTMQPLLALKPMIDSLNLLVLDIETGDLQPQRNDQMYVSGNDLFKRGKLRSINEDDLFLVIDESRLSASLNGDIPSLQILDELRYVRPGQNVYIRLQDQNYIVGPYEVVEKKNDTTGDIGLEIRPDLKNKKFIERGFKDLDDISYEFEIFDKNEPFYVDLLQHPSSNEVESLDLISDDQLISNLEKTLRQPEFIKDGNFKIEELQKLLQSEKDSVFASQEIPEQYRISRLRRVHSIFTSQEGLNDIVKDIHSFLTNLIIRNFDSEETSQLIEQTILSNDDLLKRIPAVSSMQKAINELEQRVEDLKYEADQQKKENELLSQDSSSLANSEEIANYKNQIKDLEDFITELEKEKNESSDQKIANLNSELNFLEEKRKKLEKEISDQEIIARYHENNAEIMRNRMQDVIAEGNDAILRTTYDGFIANTVLNAASKYETETKEKALNESIAIINQITPEITDSYELVDYLVETVQKERPDYSRNAILNLFINLSQNLLTVLTGEPGTGKTSISHIIGKVLGLEKIGQLSGDSKSLSRYVPISVEKGWTSKRDLIGYFNPLTKEFDSSNPALFNALRIADKEAELNQNHFPYLILLDEANLSPMEYYWSDFMRLSDQDTLKSHYISLGDRFSFEIPENLHFIATINNDQTTELLSPRLVDRSPMISLPVPADLSDSIQEITDEDVLVIPWSLMKETFDPQEIFLDFRQEVGDVYDSIIRIFRKNRISVSPRIHKSVRRFWNAASNLFEEGSTDHVDKRIAALDYAVLQRLLPKINGPKTEEWEKNLRDLLSIFKKNELNKSADKLEGILLQGESDLYYHFF